MLIEIETQNVLCFEFQFQAAKPATDSLPTALTHLNHDKAEGSVAIAIYR
jgi:hypothetical protein